MDIASIVITIFSSGIVSISTVRWLTTRLVDHRFAKDLKDYQAKLDAKLATTKAELDGQLATAKAEVESSFRRKVEEYLGDKAAEREYRLEAQKRLYTFIGPLRFQLVTACAEFANRIDRIGSGKQSFETSISGYFGQSTAFRLLRIFAITELIERQMAHADFSVDPSTADLLRFKKNAFLCLASSTISLNHPQVNWNEQIEHVYYDVLSVIATAMIVDDAESRPARAMRFDEFKRYVSDPTRLATIEPMPQLMNDFAVATKPILWVRFVALGQLCSAFVEREGPSIGIEPEQYDGVKMLNASADAFLVAQHDRYRQMLQKLAMSVKASATQSGGSANQATAKRTLSQHPLQSSLATWDCQR